MIPFRAFESLISIITGARARATQEHKEFMEFYQMLVGIVPPDVAKDFQNIKAPVSIKGVVQSGYMLELTVTDLMWWRTVINDENGRFVEGVNAIQRSIWDRLNTLATDWVLTDEQKKQLLSIDINGA